MELFTRYNVTLFLATIALAMLVLFLTLFTGGVRRRRAVKTATLQGLLVTAGLMSYLLFTKPRMTGWSLLASGMSLVLLAGLTLLVAGIARANSKTYALFAILPVTGVLFYGLPGSAFIGRLLLSAAAFPVLGYVIIILRHRGLSVLPAIDTGPLIAFGWLAVANLTGPAMALLPVDILVCCWAFWVLTLHYFRPARISLAAPSRPDPPTEELPEATVTATLAALRTAFEMEKRYLDPDLTLQSLARHTGIPARTLSVVLNRHLHQSFTDYLNRYRVSEARRLLESETHQDKTIASIAYDAGFNSLATFQRVFKKIEGKAPKMLRK